MNHIVLTRRAVNRELTVIGACTEHLDIRTIVRTIICTHRHKYALDALARLTLRELVVYCQIGNPLAYTKAAFISFRCMNIRFNVNICLICGKAHPGRLHRDRLEINECNLEMVCRILDLISNRELLESRFTDIRIDCKCGERNSANCERLFKHAEIGFLHG